MFIRGLRTKIAFNLAILLFLAMLLIDLVTIVTVKRELIRSEAFKANVLLTSFESNMLSGVLRDHRSPNSSPSSMLAKMVNDPQVAGTLVLGRNGEQVFIHHLPDVSPVRLTQFAQAAMSSGNKAIHYSGTAWGIFWKQNTYLTLSAPLIKNGATIGGISIVLTLERVYRALRNSQKIFFIYLFINLGILTYIGIIKKKTSLFLPCAKKTMNSTDCPKRSTAC